MYKHILVAVGPSFSESALQTGIARAKAFGARLTVLHVVDDMPWWAVAAASHDLGQTLAAVGEHALAVVRHCEREVRDAGIEAETLTVPLPPHGTTIAQTIARTADELEADLIVVGAGKRARWWHWELPVVEALARHTDSEILIATARDLHPTPRLETRATRSIPVRAGV